MPNIVVALEDELKERMDRLPWVNWSELAREVAFKREIFESFIRTGKLSDDEQSFCERIDWYPVDWLPLKESFVKELRRIAKGRHSKPMTAEEFTKWCNAL